MRSSESDAAVLLTNTDDVAAWQRRRLHEAVPDRFYAARLVCLLLGVGSLLSWNALITPIEYLKLRIAGSAFESSFESMFSTTFTWVSLTSLIIMQKIQHALSLRARILGSLLLLLLVFTLLTAIALQPLTLPADELLDSLSAGATTQFAVLMVSGALCGIGQAFLCGSAMAYASIFARPSYLQAVSGGQGLAGLAVTLGSLFVSLPGFQRVCAAATDDGDASAMLTSTSSASAIAASHARDVVSAAVVYFGASCAVLLLCIFGFLLVERLPFTRARKRLLHEPIGDGDSSSSSSAAAAAVEAKPPHHLRAAAPSVNHTDTSSFTDHPPTPTTTSSWPPPLSSTSPHDDNSTCQLLTNLWKWSASIFLVYAVTIAIFPSLTSTIIATDLPPSTNTTSPSSYTPSELRAHCEWSHLFVPLGFVVFNAGDTIGRNLPCVLRNPTIILAVTCARIVFAPLFMLCHTAAGGGMQLEPFGGNDALALVIMSIFSITNGWLTSSVFVASQSVIEPSKRDPAASLLVCLLNAGIAVGAALSFLVRYLDCSPSAANGYSCNPFVSPPLNVSA